MSTKISQKWTWCLVFAHFVLLHACLVVSHGTVEAALSCPGSAAHSVLSLEFVPSPSSMKATGGGVISKDGQCEMFSCYLSSFFCGNSCHNAWNAVEEKGPWIVGSTRGARRLLGHSVTVVWGFCPACCSVPGSERLVVLCCLFSPPLKV